MPLDSRYLHKYEDEFEVKVLYLVWWCADKQTLKHKRPPSRTPDAILDSRKTRPQGLLVFQNETRVLLQATVVEGMSLVFLSSFMIDRLSN